MKERPILFSGDMVRAILDGKTQTRRVVKPQPVHIDGGYFWPKREGFKIAWAAEDSAAADLPGFKVEPPIEYFLENGVCPYGKPGDRLWVRESWAVDSLDPTPRPKDGPFAWGNPIYKATFAAMINQKCEGYSAWKPSIHMPRWASRITLEITEVRVERLQDISERDAWAEGFHNPEGENRNYPDRARYWFRNLWDSINGKKHPWAANPWVWVISFRRVEA